MLDPFALHQMLYDALDASDDLILVLEHAGESDEEPLIAASNEAFCRASGLSSGKLVGTPFTALGVGADCQAIVAASRERRSFRSDMLCRRDAGTPFWFGLHLMPVPNSSPPCSIILGRDISQQRLDRRQHAAIQGLLAKVFVAVQTPVAIVDAQGAVKMNNPALDRLLGAVPGGLNGRPAIGLVAPDSQAAVSQARDRQVATGEEYRIKVRLLHADGSLVPVELASAVVRQDDLRRFRVITFTPLLEPKPPRQVTAPLPMKVVVAGRIKLIGLEDVRASLGGRWPQVADRVLRSAEHVIRQRCGSQDTWCRTKDSSFVVCFANATENEAAFRAATIARDIRTRLIGEGEAPSTAHASAITATIEVADVPGETPDALGDLIGERLNVRLAEIEERARVTLAAAVHGASCKLSAVHAVSLDNTVAHFATLPRRLEHQIQCALAALPFREAQEFDFDRLVLATAAQQEVVRIAGGDLRMMFVPVSFGVFYHRHALDRYLAACQDLDERLRKHLVLVLIDVPQGVPRSRVLDCALRLRPLCQTVCYQADNLELPPIEFSLLGDSFVVAHEVDLRHWDLDDLVKLEKLIGMAHAHRSRMLVHHVSSRAKAGRLLKLGVDMVALHDVDATDMR